MDDVRELLRREFGDRAGEPHPLGAGEWSKAYAFRLDGRDAVLRLSAYGNDFAKDRIMGQLAARTGLPVPQTLAAGIAPAGFYSVTERVFGTMLDDLGADGMRAALPRLLETLDALGTLDLSHTAGYGLWSPDQEAPAPSWREALLRVREPSERLHGWRAALETSPADAAAFTRGVARLEEMSRDLPEHRSIIHSDLLNRNVLVENTRISGMIDWGNALYGDPLYDAAWLIHWWPWYPAWSAIDIEAQLERHWRSRGELPYMLAQRLACYRLHIGLDAIAYSAFRRRWADVRTYAAQVARCL